MNATAASINFATYITGTDYLDALASDSSGDFYVTGQTSELNLPVQTNAFQKAIVPSQNCTCDAGYIVKIDGQRKSALAATYLSGTTIAQQIGTVFTAIGLDNHSNVFVGGGATATPDFPLQNPFVTTLQFTTAASGTVLAEMNPDFSGLLFGSYLSATSGQLAGSQFGSLTVDSQDNLIVAGQTFSPSFPVTPNSFQTALPNTNPLQTSLHGFISKINVSTPAPSVCLNPLGVNFGAALVNTSTSQTLTITNCGNAALQFSSIASSDPTVTAAQSCGAIQPGNSCNLQLTFTPTASTAVSGTITLTDNAAISQQTVTFAGNVGAPRITFPTTFTASDLVVGTQAEFFISFINQGTGNWIVGSAAASGDGDQRDATDNDVFKRTAYFTAESSSCGCSANRRNTSYRGEPISRWRELESVPVNDLLRNAKCRFAA